MRINRDVARQFGHPPALELFDRVIRDSEFRACYRTLAALLAYAKASSPS